jgi:hypothetical protein
MFHVKHVDSRGVLAPLPPDLTDPRVSDRMAQRQLVNRESVAYLIRSTARSRRIDECGASAREREECFT